MPQDRKMWLLTSTLENGTLTIFFEFNLKKNLSTEIRTVLLSTLQGSAKTCLCSQR